MTPITKDRKNALIPQNLREALAHLNRSARIDVAVVSGRTVPELKKFIGLSDFLYAGNHGFEIIKGDKLLLRKGHAFRRLIKKVRKKLTRTFEDFARTGILIEDKSLSVAIHYREAINKSVLPAHAIKQLALDAINEIGDGKKLNLKKGKKVFEIVPDVGWHKGKAVKWILEDYFGISRARNAVVVYVGDDKTDEDAFLEIKKLKFVEAFSVLVSNGF